MVRRGEGWHERLVAAQDLLFLPIAGPPVPGEIIPEPLREAEAGSVIEVSPASVGVMRALSARIAAQGGAALIVDYGYEGPAIADTLQAVRGHAYANPFDRPGEQDLSAHVDFTTLAAAAQSTGLAAFGPVTQRDLLGALGIDQRTASLARAHPDRADALLADPQPVDAGHGHAVPRAGSGAARLAGACGIWRMIAIATRCPVTDRRWPRWRRRPLPRPSAISTRPPT